MKEITLRVPLMARDKRHAQGIHAEYLTVRETTSVWLPFAMSPTRPVFHLVHPDQPRRLTRCREPLTRLDATGHQVAAGHLMQVRFVNTDVVRLCSKCARTTGVLHP